MHPLMYDRGRGPELRRIRITVYDLIPYLESGRWTDPEIVGALPITAEELAALKQHIADHRDEVMAVHARIEERIRRGREESERKLEERYRQFGRPPVAIRYFPDWVKQREAEAATGGPPLPADPAERARMFLAWRRSHLHVNGVAR